MSSAFATRLNFLSLFLSIATCSANTLINFEPPLPSGLVAMSFWEDTPVVPQSRITNQYSNLGILMKNVALVNLGSGQATSGINGIAPTSVSGKIDYGSQATFTFVDPQNNASPATTDYFAISTDQSGGSGNTTTISGYDLNGNFLGSVSHIDTGGIMLQLQNIGKIHTIVVGSTLINHGSGGIALDDVRFGTPSSSTTVPPGIGSHICTNASLSGSYGFTISGGVQIGSFVPFAESGSVTSDGNGNVTGSATASQDGQIIPRTLIGTYTVNSDCTGAAGFTDSLGNSSNINFVIVDSGREVNFMEADSGAVVSGVAKQQQSGCTIGSINGAYGYAISGWTGTTDAYAESGKVVADGAGGLSLQSTASQAGTIATGNGSGSYSVNADCTGTATFSNGAHLNLVILASGREVQFIQTDSGTTISGSAQRLLASNKILPQVAFGGGWYTALYFTNTRTSAVSFPVSFVGNDGIPLSLPSVGGSSTTINLAPHGAAIIEAPNVGRLTQGYAVMSLPGSVLGYGIFRWSAAGRADQEAVVPLSDASTTASTLIWDDTNFVTAVSIVNPSAVATVVSISLRDTAGNLIGTSTIPLLANSKTAATLRSLPGLAGVVGRRGSADFTVASGNVAVLGLRANGAAITSIPTADK